MGKIRKWLGYGRVGALVQSVMPAVVAAVLAAGEDGFSILLALLAIIGVEAAHLAMNLADDWFDYRVDMSGDRDRVVRKGFRAMTVKYPYLSDGSETVHTLGKAIAQFSITACICGAIIFIYRILHNGFTGSDGAWWIVAIAGATAFLGAFYSAPPLKLAYRGLGELTIGVIFGPLLMMGVYYSACGRVSSDIVWTSIPIGLLVLNILFTHSFIDMAGDAESNKMTFARLLRTPGANLVAAYLFNLLPFAMVVAAVAFGKISAMYLLVLLALPRAIWLCASLTRFSRGDASVPEKPYKWLGAMAKDWEAVRKAGVDWFLMRWFTSRNLLSLFCLLIIVGRLLTFVI